MRILFVNAYFMPESIAFSHLEKDLIESIIEAGHEIEVLCPIPTRGISEDVYKKYRNIKHEVLYDGKVTVNRFWAPREVKNILIRTFRYFWCNIREYQIGIKYKNIDAIFSVSTPPTQGLIAGMISKKLNCPFVYSLQDIFPDSLLTTKLAKKDGLLWKIGRKIEDYTYRHSDKIIVISEGFKRNIMAKGVEESRISVISNWIDMDSVHPISREDNTLYDELEISRNKFTVVYAGNFGEAQGAEIVLDAAEALKNDDNIQFAIFGGGTHYEDAKNRAKGMRNVIIHKLLPVERVSDVYSLGDVAVITCKLGAGICAMPSKTWSIMACNTPIIASFDMDSNLAEVLKAAGAGVCVVPGDVETLVKEIRLLCDSRNTPKRNSLNLREYIKNNADKITCTQKYVNLLNCSIKQKDLKSK